MLGIYQYMKKQNSKMKWWLIKMFKIIKLTTDLTKKALIYIKVKDKVETEA